MTNGNSIVSGRELIFGSDLGLIAISGTYDLVVAPSGDLALARGNVNIEQALSLRLAVSVGELADLGFPDYGSRLDEVKGQPNIQRTRVRALGLARSAVEQDPRVRQVLRTEARPGQQDLLQIEMEIELIYENTPSNLVFDLRLTGV